MDSFQPFIDNQLQEYIKESQVKIFKTARGVEISWRNTQLYALELISEKDILSTLLLLCLLAEAFQGLMVIYSKRMKNR